MLLSSTFLFLLLFTMCKQMEVSISNQIGYFYQHYCEVRMNITVPIGQKDTFFILTLPSDSPISFTNHYQPYTIHTVHGEDLQFYPKSMCITNTKKLCVSIPSDRFHRQFGHRLNDTHQMLSFSLHNVVCPPLGFENVIFQIQMFEGLSSTVVIEEQEVGYTFEGLQSFIVQNVTINQNHNLSQNNTEATYYNSDCWSNLQVSFLIYNHSQKNSWQNLELQLSDNIFTVKQKSMSTTVQIGTNRNMQPYVNPNFINISQPNQEIFYSEVQNGYISFKNTHFQFRENSLLNTYSIDDYDIYQLPPLKYMFSIPIKFKEPSNISLKVQINSQKPDKSKIFLFEKTHTISIVSSQSNISSEIMKCSEGGGEEDDSFDIQTFIKSKMGVNTIILLTCLIVMIIAFLFCKKICVAEKYAYFISIFLFLFIKIGLWVILSNCDLKIVQKQKKQIAFLILLIIGGQYILFNFIVNLANLLLICKIKHKNSKKQNKQEQNPNKKGILSILCLIFITFLNHRYFSVHVFNLRESSKFRTVFLLHSWILILQCFIIYISIAIVLILTNIQWIHIFFTICSLLEIIVILRVSSCMRKKIKNKKIGKQQKEQMKNEEEELPKEEENVQPQQFYADKEMITQERCIQRSSSQQQSQKYQSQNSNHDE